MILWTGLRAPLPAHSVEVRPKLAARVKAGIQSTKLRLQSRFGAAVGGGWSCRAVSSNGPLFRRDDRLWRCAAHWKSRRNSGLTFPREPYPARRDEEPGHDGKRRAWTGVRSQLSSFMDAPPFGKRKGDATPPWGDSSPVFDYSGRLLPSTHKTQTISQNSALAEIPYETP